MVTEVGAQLQPICKRRFHSRSKRRRKDMRSSLTCAGLRGVVFDPSGRNYRRAFSQAYLTGKRRPKEQTLRANVALSRVSGSNALRGHSDRRHHR